MARPGINRAPHQPGYINLVMKMFVTVKLQWGFGWPWLCGHVATVSDNFRLLSVWGETIIYLWVEDISK